MNCSGGTPRKSTDDVDVGVEAAAGVVVRAVLDDDDEAGVSDKLDGSADADAAAGGGSAVVGGDEAPAPPLLKIAGE